MFYIKEGEMPYIIGNWKMNGTKTEAQSLASELVSYINTQTTPLPHVVICPPYPYLFSVKDSLASSALQLGAQDCSPEKNGSFTGDVSVSQLIDTGCTHVIIGHSERRHYHQESADLIRRKVDAALKGGLKPILCIGEEATDYKQGNVFSVLTKQLASNLPLEDLTPENFLIAYEPVWAIGTGLTPNPEEIEAVGAFIKKTLAETLGKDADIPVLYGGSANATNAASFLHLHSINGLLVGTASLKVEDFTQIIQIAGTPL